jgi:hypothetical protein
MHSEPAHQHERVVVVTSSLGIVAWAAAAANGIEFSNRGRVPADVIEKYKAAGN